MALSRELVGTDGVTVGFQHESAGMAQYRGDRLRVHPLGDHLGCETVTQVVPAPAFHPFASVVKVVGDEFSVPVSTSTERRTPALTAAGYKYVWLAILPQRGFARLFEKLGYETKLVKFLLPIPGCWILGVERFRKMNIILAPANK
jgi:hypothetical protein